MSKDGFLNIDSLSGKCKETRLKVGDFEYDKHPFEGEHLLDIEADFIDEKGLRYHG